MLQEKERKYISVICICRVYISVQHFSKQAHESAYMYISTYAAADSPSAEAGLDYSFSFPSMLSPPCNVFVIIL